MYFGRYFALLVGKRGLKLLRNAIKHEFLRLMSNPGDNPDEEEADFEDAKVLHHIKEDIDRILLKKDP